MSRRCKTQSTKTMVERPSEFVGVGTIVVSSRSERVLVARRVRPELEVPGG